MSSHATTDAAGRHSGPGGPGSGLNASEIRQFSAITALAVVAIVLEFVFHADPILLFIVSGVAVGGMAHVLGVATEQAAAAAGPRLSALLNATFGNAAELIIVVLAINQGLIEIAKFSIIGSVLGNVLLILGASILAGGLRHGDQTFDRHVIGLNASTLVLATVALSIPSIYHATTEATLDDEVGLSVGIALVMLLVYGAYIYASFQHPEEITTGPADVGTERHEPDAEHHGPRWSVPLALGMLGFSAVATAILAEILVSAIEPTIEETGISEVFIGLIVVPLVGNIAEHLAALRIAYGGNIDFAMGIAFNSALQVALAVSALAVLAALAPGTEVTLVFTVLEVALLFAATILAEAIASNGRSTWLEGLQLLSIYVIAAIVFWYT